MLPLKLVKAIFIIAVLVLGIGAVTFYKHYRKHDVIVVRKPESATNKCAVGRQLFAANCRTCHSINSKLTGPPLGPSAANRKRDWFIQFTLNYNKLMKSGDKEALKAIRDYDGMPMTVFPNLTEQQAGIILDYINECGAEEK